MIFPSFRIAPRTFVLAFLAAIAGAACSSDLTLSSPLGPGQETEAMLAVLSVAPDSPPPEAAILSFVAQKGRSTDGRVYLTDGHGHRGAEFLRFTVGRNSLLARPDGRAFANGDTITITIRVIDPARILFEMQPAGLTFSPADPAELRIRYQAAGDDLDRNGRHDVEDDSLETHLGIWRQAIPGAPFVRLPSSVSHAHRDIRTDVTEFSRYAIAY